MKNRNKEEGMRKGEELNTVQRNEKREQMEKRGGEKRRNSYEEKRKTEGMNRS